MIRADSPIFSLDPAVAGDFEMLLGLRMEAMRESLERLGRFDLERARARFQSSFEPGYTRHVICDRVRAGFVAVKPEADHWLLDHLYFAKAARRRGLGAAVLAVVFAEADAANVELRVGALKQSDSNRFYLRHGFIPCGESEWDVYYARDVSARPQPKAPSGRV